MPPYRYPLPTTANITLGASLFIDPQSSHTTNLADATLARTKLHIALDAAHNGGTALAVVDGYLPYLLGIQQCLDTDELLWKGDPAFSWRSSLTSYQLSPPLLPYPTLHAETLFVLLTYALALSNYARALLDALPASDSGQMTADEQARISAGLTRAVDLLSQGSGIAEWAAENVCGAVESARNAAGRLGKSKWPVETGTEALRGISMMMLADAHMVAIRKLLLPVWSHMLFAPPGPPLPPKHPSPSLLAKLHLHVASLYTSSAALFHAHIDGKKIKKQDVESVDGEVIPELSRYLRKEALFSGALAHKWLGVEAGEDTKGKRVGEALAWLKEAQNRLKELEDGKVREKMKGLSLGRKSKKEERSARKNRVERELEDMAAWSRTYQQMNDTVAFQPVPAIGALSTPSGRPIFAAKPFKPPRAKMGLQSATATPVDEYAGKGSYF